MLTRCRVSDRGRADVASDDKTGVEANTQLHNQPVAARHVRSQALRLRLNVQGGQTCPSSVIFQSFRRAEQRHDSVAGELIQTAAVPLNHCRTTIDQIGHQLAQALRTQRSCDVHRPHHIGEQHCDLFVLGELCFGLEWRTTGIAEPGVLTRFGATLSTRRRWCRHTGRIGAVGDRWRVTRGTVACGWVVSFTDESVAGSGTYAHHRSLVAGCPSGTHGTPVTSPNRAFCDFAASPAGTKR